MFGAREGRRGTHPLLGIHVEGFRSLADVDVELGAFSVLIGPNGSGKTNLLAALAFVRDVARHDLGPALARSGGVDRVRRQSPNAGEVSIALRLHLGAVTEYALGFDPDRSGQDRRELLAGAHAPRRIEIAGAAITVDRVESSVRLASSDTSGLGTLARLGSGEFGSGPGELMSFLTGIRFLDPDVASARRPVRLAPGPLADDASNLASALYRLREEEPAAFGRLRNDLSRCLPGLVSVEIAEVGGSSPSVVVQLHEAGVTMPIDLADASFGTVRLLALLTALHDPYPPALTVIEEVDHGLHPHALDILADRMRAASERTQIIAASHSPTLVNRLAPGEIVVCDRDPATGESLIPAVDADDITAALAATDLRPGELWFAGALDGVPQ